MLKEKQYYSETVEDVLKSLNSQKTGLGEEEFRKRLLQYGRNKLPEIKQESFFSVFLRQFQSPLIYILIISGLIILWNQEFVDALIIFFVIFFNAAIGTFQEGRARNSFLALKKLARGTAVVLRENQEKIIGDEKIVPGDIIILREGEKVPADARIISSLSLKINESALTGESIPVFKKSEPLEKKNIPPTEQNNMIFKGTVVTYGSGKAVVVATGEKTFFGKIAREVLDIQSSFPLKNELKKLSKWIIFALIITSIFISWLEITNEKSFLETLKTIVAISVSAIPEGLPIVITLTLARGVWLMGKKKVLVKKLQAVEVLGETGVLAVDKTGTLTKNELAVEKVYVAGKIFHVETSGYHSEGKIFLDEKTIDPPNHPEILLAGKISALNSNVSLEYNSKKNIWKISGDPTEAAMLVFSKKAGFHREKLLEEMPIVQELPFDYSLLFHASLHKFQDENFLAVTGSPEKILSLSAREWTETEVRPLSEKGRNEIENVMRQMFENGMRVIGFAYRNDVDSESNLKKIHNLIFGGFFAIKDTLRPEVIKSVNQVTAAGIKVVMVTGDNAIAAQSIAAEAGILRQYSPEKIIEGKKIEIMSDKELAQTIKKISIFARVSPEHKLKIIKAYQNSGMVIAMTGDGVNDTLSLAAADIGIGMGKIGTDVAKESADIILLDDNFGNIVYGIQEGKNIFYSIRKVVLYLLSTGIGEILAIFGALLLSLPLPVLAAQILWLNLITDGFLDVSLAMEPNEGSSNYNNKKKVLLFDPGMANRMLLMAGTMAVFTVYFFQINSSINIVWAQTFSLTLLAVFQWFNAWNCRSEERSIFQMNFFSNKPLLLSTLLVVFLQIIAVYSPFMQKTFQTVPLSPKDWFVIIISASSILWIEEIRKYFLRRKKIKSSL